MARGAGEERTRKTREMTKAEEVAMDAYPRLTIASVCLDGTTPVDLNTGARKRFIEGYKQAEKDILAIIETRISEIIGDAQPKPILRAELQELITRIKHED